MLLLGALALPAPAQAVVRYVAQDATGAGNGTSWGDAFLHPQDAVNAAARGDQVWVKEARYLRKRGAPQVLSLKNGVAVYGGFAGDESSLAQRDPALHETILDGEHAVEHVVITPGGGRLDGFTVTGGGLLSVGSSVGGGFHGDSATLVRIVFAGNRALVGGGAAGADLVIEDSLFQDNVAETSGGALGVGGDVQVRRCSFVRNTCLDPLAFGNGFGGAISATWGVLQVEDSSFDANVSVAGGAIHVETGAASTALRVLRSSFTGNQATLGGAVVTGFAVAELTIEDSSFSGNAVTTRVYTVCDPTCHDVVVPGQGGAVAAHSGVTTLRNSTFSANTAQMHGGALYVKSTSAVIEGSRFEDNSASFGGGIYFDRAPHFVSDTVFLRNRAITGSGGAVALYPTEPPFVPTTGTFERCRFEENVAGDAGGALALYDGDIDVESGRFVGNQANSGGAVYGAGLSGLVQPRVALRNSVIAFNHASTFGGGVDLGGTISRLENDTFYGNAAGSFGGGLFAYAGADLTVLNTILWNDTAPTWPEIGIQQGSLTSLSVEYSDVQGGWPGTGNLNVDPGLRDPFLFDFHLTWPGSKLLVDAGTPGFSPVYDFDGELRPIDGDLDGNARVDIGADELADPCAGHGDTDFDGRCDPMDNCPYEPNPGQQDSGGLGLGDVPDGIGDACQCGDVSGDGRITIADTVMILRALLVPPKASLVKPELCDVGGSSGCSVADAVIIRRALLVPPTATVQQVCAPALP